jgi:hypothetical protein
MLQPLMGASTACTVSYRLCMQPVSSSNNSEGKETSYHYSHVHLGMHSIMQRVIGLRGSGSTSPAP